MSSVIDFLEKMGRDAWLHHASQNEVELALASEPIDSELQAAILARNSSQLGVLLGQGIYCCMQEPGKEDEDEDEDSEETPLREGSGKVSHYGFRALVSVD
jgi:hypothetical protein